jgi:hypothetical protein
MLKSVSKIHRAALSFPVGAGVTGACRAGRVPDEGWTGDDGGGEPAGELDGVVQERDRFLQWDLQNTRLSICIG